MGLTPVFVFWPLVAWLVPARQRSPIIDAGPGALRADLPALRGIANFSSGLNSGLNNRLIPRIANKTRPG